MLDHIRTFFSTSTLEAVNLWLAAVMVLCIAISTIPLAFRVTDPKSRHLERMTALALGFWLGWWIVLVVVYSLLSQVPYWITLIFDGIGSVCILGSSVFLLPEPVHYTRRQLASCVTGSLGLLIVWPLLLGGHTYPGDHGIAWKSFVAAPGMIMSVAGFFILAYGGLHVSRPTGRRFGYFAASMLSFRYPATWV